MLTPTNKREASLSILQRLRQKGLPEREEKVDSMFDSLAANDEGEEDADKKPLPNVEIEDDQASPPQPALASPAKKKGPNLNPEKTKQFMKAFKGVR